MKILALESTCDETGAAVVEAVVVESGVEVLSSVVASSSEMHEKYGGIVPEVAAREQVKVVTSVIEEAMKGVKREEIEAIAVSVGPGLIGSLLIGVETAKALAMAWEKQLIPVNHLKGHLMANMIRGEDGGMAALPAIGLLVSGGHTELVKMKGIGEWEWIGGTRDDAAGECFDKCARLLELGYPGGPAIQKWAEKGEGGSKEVKLPRPMIHDGSLEMSFSGLKAAVAKLVESRKSLSNSDKCLIARELNEAVVEVLVSKTMKAVDDYRYANVWLAGGVAANKMLREELERRCVEAGVKLWMPEFKYCTDNAAMIGAAGIMQLLDKSWVRPGVLEVRAEPGMGL